MLNYIFTLKVNWLDNGWVEIDKMSTCIYIQVNIAEDRNE